MRSTNSPVYSLRIHERRIGARRRNATRCECVDSDDLRLSHEYLAMMLGARRASVTEGLHPLQKEALVRSQCGQITILDGAGLEYRSCECYFVVRDEIDQLLGSET